MNGSSKNLFWQLQQRCLKVNTAQAIKKKEIKYEKNSSLYDANFSEKGAFGICR